jgi:branched-chain amino acid transport system permease protein
MDSFYLQQLINGFSTGMTYVLLALGLTLVFGVLHVVNFAHGEFYMLGALAAYLGMSQLDLPYPIALIGAMLAVGLVAYVVDRVAVRPMLARPSGQGDTLLSTYAVSLLLYDGVLEIWGPTPQAVAGIPGSLDAFGMTLTYQRIFVLACGLVLIASVHAWLHYTRFGKQVQALAQSRFASAVVGIPVRKVGTQTYVVAGLLAGAAGALMVPILTFSPQIGQNVITKAFVVVVIGGMGSVRGTVICGLALGILETYGSMYFSTTISLALVYAMLILVLLFKSEGLFGKQS